MFVVYENDKPAIIEGTISWSNNKFDTLEEAKRYVNDWIGLYCINAWLLDVNAPYHFNGEDSITIKEEI